MSAAAAVAPSSSPAVAPGQPGAVLLFGRRVSWDSLIVAGATLLGIIVLWSLNKSTSASAALGVPASADPNAIASPSTTPGSVIGSTPGTVLGGGVPPTSNPSPPPAAPPSLIGALLGGGAKQQSMQTGTAVMSTQATVASNQPPQTNSTPPPKAVATVVGPRPAAAVALFQAQPAARPQGGLAPARGSLPAIHAVPTTVTPSSPYLEGHGAFA